MAQGLTDISRFVQAAEGKRGKIPMTDAEATHWYLMVPPQLRPKIAAAAQQVADRSKTRENPVRTDVVVVALARTLPREHERWCRVVYARPS